MCTGRLRPAAGSPGEAATVGLEVRCDRLALGVVEGDAHGQVWMIGPHADGRPGQDGCPLLGVEAEAHEVGRCALTGRCHLLGDSAGPASLDLDEDAVLDALQI